MLFEKVLLRNQNTEKKGKSKGWRMGAPAPKSKGEAYGNGVVGVNPAKALYLIPSTPDFTPASLRNCLPRDGPYSRVNPEG